VALVNVATVELSTPDGPARALLAEPTGPVRGGVVVGQEEFGLTDYVAAVCMRLAEAGHYAIAPALYHRLGSDGADPVLGPDDAEEARLLARQLTGDGLREDVDAALAELTSRRLLLAGCGIVGFSLGGVVATHVAARRAVGAAVSFSAVGLGVARFGLPTPIEAAEQLQAPLLGLFGDADPGAPEADVERFRVALHVADVPTEVERYPGAGHRFYSGRPEDYAPAALEDAWVRCFAWLDRHLLPPQHL
jgi:carboxymethylenebutenolidase